jgi:hypothetical protein
MHTLFWDFNELILEHYQNHRLMINSGQYCAVLEEKLKPVVCNKSRRILTNVVVLNYDSAQPHMAAVIQKLEFGLLPHIPHSPNLGPSDYHIFELLEDLLCGLWVTNNEVKDAVHTWLCVPLKTFFADGIRKLVDQNNKSVWGTFCRIKKIILVQSRKLANSVQ